MMWKIFGWIFVAIGILGLTLPVIPTVPFLLVALFCFERGSPELHQWLLDHRTFGPPLRAWKEHRVIRPRTKAIAVVCISSSMIYVVFFKSVVLPLKIAVSVTSFAVILFILTRKSRP